MFNRKEKKFQKKLQFYSKVKDTVSALGVQKTVNKKKRVRSWQKKTKAYDFSSLSDLLPDLEIPSTLPDTRKIKISCKNKNKLAETEGKRYKAFINDPLFQADPFSAIHRHLQATQPAVATPAKNVTKTGKKSKTKRKKVGLWSGTQNMDM